MRMPLKNLKLLMFGSVVLGAVALYVSTYLVEDQVVAFTLRVFSIFCAGIAASVLAEAIVPAQTSERDSLSPAAKRSSFRVDMHEGPMYVHASGFTVERDGNLLFYSNESPVASFEPGEWKCVVDISVLDTRPSVHTYVEYGRGP
jgi:hypothetical protein